MKFYTSVLWGLSVLALVLPGTVRSEEPNGTAVLVCRSHQCADASYATSKGFLFNKIDQMLQNNVGRPVLICEADPQTHVCLEEGLTIPAKTALSPLNVVIKDLRLVDTKLLPGQTSADFVLDYRIRVNDTFPNCQLGISNIKVDDVNRVWFSTQDFGCQITQTGHTDFNATYSVDYLDFDYGFVGAYYTLAASGSVQGDRTGYALLRFTAPPQMAVIETPDETEDAVSETKADVVEETVPSESIPIPDIVRDTAPEVVSSEEPVAVPVVVSEPSAPSEPITNTEVVETNIRVVSTPDEPVQAVIPTPQSRVVRTTTIERTVILPDGTRQVSPPEIRTVVDGLETVTAK